MRFTLPEAPLASLFWMLAFTILGPLLDVDETRQDSVEPERDDETDVERDVGGEGKGETVHDCTPEHRAQAPGANDIVIGILREKPVNSGVGPLVLTFSCACLSVSAQIRIPSHCYNMNAPTKSSKVALPPYTSTWPAHLARHISGARIKSVASGA